MDADRNGRCYDWRTICRSGDLRLSKIGGNELTHYLSPARQG
jgi:hypothetical protein